MSDPNLDSIGGCITELTECNRTVAEFAPEWSQKAGELKAAEKRYERLYKAAMRGNTGANADERAATAQAAVEEVEPGLAEKIENLIGTVEQHKRHFETIDRRSSNAQSILSMHRRSANLEDFVPREALRMAQQGEQS